LIKKFDRLKTKMSNDPANYHVETENPNIQHPVEANPPSIEPPVETENYIIDINNFNKKNKKITKNSDGFYYVNGVKYNKLYGSRQDVWDKVAFQTTGCLTKLHFTINKNGKIVSKKKSIQEMQNNKFFIHGVNNLSQNEI
jgi:hypothetical protein